ncbi:hypothetical protein Bpfe_004673 [Biomphalaria pfeifferi]|uniref:Uncharacterized protein n=1 Tax=Biomphalaria pfeifferi TaxID=112525 RepID=A0AAD8C3K9_BIOPF|nr:hypothetical protein Bpfe_004673 [Biomphalaria pfeifferi]
MKLQSTQFVQMNHIPPYQDSTYAVHQRYEDTSYIIFHQIQKNKPKGRPQGSLNGSLAGSQLRSQQGGIVTVRSDRSAVRSPEHKTPTSKKKLL